jgi:osmoprotectant transport system permease protein
VTGWRVIRSPVPLALAAAGALAAWLAPFLTHAPNRLLDGQPLMLGGSRLWLVLAAVGALSLAPRVGRSALALGAVSLDGLDEVLRSAGWRAADLAAQSGPAARTSLGPGAWVLLAVFALALGEAARGRSRAWASLPLALVALDLRGGGLDQLSLLREYATRHEVFAADLERHVTLVLATLAPTLAIGVPLGWLAQRRPGLRSGVFGVLNIVQTIPSIALFGLLMAPLAGLGVGGTGLAPAIVALTLYCLLPIARNTAAGLDGVAPDVLDAARGMGMGRAAILWQVEAPLAMPVFLSGLRITVVQAIGLAMVAALIGAGGLGALMFEGLFSDALDLVLLGVIPAVLLALLADAALGALQARA